MKIFAPGHNPNLPITLFYGGTERLAFDKEAWKWYKLFDDGTRKPMYGVTSVLKIIAKEAIGPWMVKVALAKVKSLLIAGGYVGGEWALFENVLDEILAKAKKEDRDILEDAGNLGHEAHAFLQEYGDLTLAGKCDRRLELLAHFPNDDRVANCCVAGLAFFSAHNVRFIHCERPVYSRKYQCVGTADAICLTDSCDDSACCPEFFRDSKTLLDYKTSNALYGSYLAQAALYAHAYEEETGEHIERRFVLRLGKTECEFESWHMAGDKLQAEDLALYVHALELYQSVHLVDDRIAEMSRKATAVKRALEKIVRDAKYAIKCLEADEYKGVKRKKGCNDTDKMCMACEEIYAKRHLPAT